MASTHVVESTQETVRSGYLDPAAKPTAVIAPGDTAYALASMAVSFRVTRYANQTGSAYTSIPPKAVHAVIPKMIFPAEIRDRVARWLPASARCRDVNPGAERLGRRPVERRCGTVQSTRD